VRDIPPAAVPDADTAALLNRGCRTLQASLSSLQSAVAGLGGALAELHFEAIGQENARQVLHAYGRGYRVFSDVQGTGAVVLAAVYAAIRVTGIPMKYQTVVAYGAGAAIADQLRDAMVADGASEEQARSQVWLVGTPAPAGLTETVDEAAPTILLGTSAVEGHSPGLSSRPCAGRPAGR
jgi:hypothetical protein